MSEQDMSQAGSATGPKNRRWVGPLLLVSLVINVFLLAHVAVGTFHHGRSGHSGATMFGMTHGAVMGALTTEERRSIHQMMRAHGAGIPGYLADIRAARIALSEAVAAEPYDKEATKQAFANLRAAIAAIAASSQDALIDVFASLPVETRGRISEALREPRRGWPGHGPHGHERGDPDYPSGSPTK